MMVKEKREWRPSPEEVRRIVEEMRPILRDQARRAVAADADRRHRLAG